MVVNTETGKLYFIEQLIKLGLYDGGTGLKQKDPVTGKKELAELKMAKKGTCSNTNHTE